MLFQVLSIDRLGKLSFLSYHWLKSKDEKKLYLSLFKIIADILKYSF